METQKASVMGFPEEVIAILSKPIDPAALSKAPRGLTSIKSIYITERLNQAFGLGRWHVSDEVVNLSERPTIPASDEWDKATPAVTWVVVKATMELADYPWFKASSYGGNNNPDLGDAYKGAVSDAISKICAMYLGVAVDVFKGLSAERSAENGHSNGNGHKPEVQRVSQAKVEAPPKASGSKDAPEGKRISEKQVKRFNALVIGSGKDWEEVDEKLASIGLSGIAFCPWGKPYEDLCAWAEAK